MPSKTPENIFLSNHIEPYAQIIEHENYSFGVYCLKSKSRESDENEDALFLSFDNNVIRAGVVDGAGGHPKGKEAAFEVADHMHTISDVGILSQIDLANERVKNLKVGARATLAMTLIHEDHVNFHTVGDSEVIYWNAGAREVYSSIPHSIVGAKIEAGVTSQKESLDDPERHIVTNMMGDHFVRVSSTTSFELKKGHSIFMGSDGVFDNISHEILEETVAKGKFEDSFQEICRICDEQNPATWNKDDDISFIFIRKMRS